MFGGCVGVPKGLQFLSEGIQLGLKNSSCAAVMLFFSFLTAANLCIYVTSRRVHRSPSAAQLASGLNAGRSEGRGSDGDADLRLYFRRVYEVDYG